MVWCSCSIRPISTRLSSIGSLIAILTFLATLTFLFSLPGWEKSLGGFPALSGSGGFLLEDVVLLGAALFTLGDSLNASKRYAAIPNSSGVIGMVHIDDVAVIILHERAN